MHWPTCDRYTKKFMVRMPRGSATRKVVVSGLHAPERVHAITARVERAAFLARIAPASHQRAHPKARMSAPDDEIRMHLPGMGEDQADEIGPSDSYAKDVALTPWHRK